MALRKYQEKNESAHPHIGKVVKNVMVRMHVTQAELSRRIGVNPSTVANYLKQSSLQLGILWNLGIALDHDFLTELTDFYPPELPLSKKSKLMKEFLAQEILINEMKKEIEIYKAALGIKP